MKRYGIMMAGAAALLLITGVPLLADQRRTADREAAFLAWAEDDGWPARTTDDPLEVGYWVCENIEAGGFQLAATGFAVYVPYDQATAAVMAIDGTLCGES